MNIADVIDLYTQLDHLGIEVWLDGGWGVDALLGEQTRPHSDVDIVIQHKDAPKLRELLERQGYQDVPRDDKVPGISSWVMIRVAWWMCMRLRLMPRETVSFLP